MESFTRMYRDHYCHSVKSCSAGQKASPSTCTPCDQGTYQPNSDQKDCISCGGAAYTTAGTGTQQQTGCRKLHLFI